jgi:undecaprenyl diphosphate synthase
MFILKAHLDSFNRKKENTNIKINVIGDISQLSKSIQDSIIKAKKELKIIKV